MTRGSHAAVLRRHEREERRRARELARQAKEAQRLSELENARLEVAAYESAVAMALSIHKDCAERVDWAKVERELRPHPPPALRTKRARAEIVSALRRVGSSLYAPVDPQAAETEDLEEHARLIEAHAREAAETIELRSLAARVRAGDPVAYRQVFVKLFPADELQALGTVASLEVVDARLVTSYVRVRGREAIPSESKSLTATGKLTTKQTPKARMHELYQDYVCSATIRVAREIFAILPVDTILVHVSVCEGESPSDPGIIVLSVELSRGGVESLRFDTLDPSDTVETFRHRGDVKVSRKSGEFVAVVPLEPSPSALTSGSTRRGLAELREDLRRLRSALAALGTKGARQTSASQTQRSNP